jgi:hypothetical protein
MDRMGRDYLRVGLYREMFRERGVRLIAVGEGYDSNNGEDDFTPFKDIISLSPTKYYPQESRQALKNQRLSPNPEDN